MDIYCPHCGKPFSYGIAARQAQNNVKFNRKILCEIIQEKKKLTTGELITFYKERTDQVIGVRLIGYFLRQLESEKVIRRKVVSFGRYGRTTQITFTRRKIPDYLLKTPKVMTAKIIPKFPLDLEIRGVEAGIGERIVADDKGRFILVKKSSFDAETSRT